MVKDGGGSKDARLAYVRSYRPKGKVDFAGPSYFGGTTKDDLVLVPTKSVPCASHIWSIWPHDFIQECRDSRMGQGHRSTCLPYFDSNHPLTCISQTLLHTLKTKDGGELTGVAWNYASDQFMLASASHDGTVRLWTTPDPLPVLESEFDAKPEHENTRPGPRRSETLTSSRSETLTNSEGMAAHSSSGRSTPAPFADEPQSMKSSPDEVGAPPGVRYQRVDSPAHADVDTSHPPQPNSIK
jgi:hypothetical protein